MTKKLKEEWLRTTCLAWMTFSVYLTITIGLLIAGNPFAALPWMGMTLFLVMIAPSITEHYLIGEDN